MPEINFNASAIPEGRSAIPAGDYMVWINGSKLVYGDKDDQQQQQPNPNDPKQRLVLKIEILQPESMAGQSIEEGYWMKHPNPKAVEVSNRLLANVCRAVGQMAPHQSEQLHQIPFWARLDVKELESGALVNEIRAVWSTQSQAPPLMKARAQKPQQQGFVPGAQSGFMPPPQAQAQPWQQAPQQAPMAPQLGQPVQQPQYQAPMAQPLQQHPPQGYQTQWAQQPGQPPFPPQQAYEQPAPAATPGQPQQGGFNPPVKQTPPPWAQQPGQPGQNGIPF